MATVPTMRLRRLLENRAPWAASWPMMNRPAMTMPESTHRAMVMNGLVMRTRPAMMPAYITRSRPK